ncbi:MAG: PilZ domain-containing protein [Treponema sp.]|nr:PilZ domain-containing protein [Treponema sp.]
MQTYFKKDDPESAIFFLIVTGSLLGTVIFVRLILRVAGIASPANKNSAVPVRRFRCFALRRAAYSYGLTRDQANMLEFVFTSGGVSDPKKTLSNPALVDKYFKRAYLAFERHIKNNEEAEIQIARLFSTRNAIEFGWNILYGGISPPASAGMSAVLTVGRNTYSVKILNARDDYIAVECSANAPGSPVKAVSGAKAAISFFSGSGKDFFMEGEIAGISSAQSRWILEITRFSRPMDLGRRRFRRRQIEISCFVRPVNIKEIGHGRNKTVKMTVNRIRLAGTIQNISLTGCAIKINADIAADSLVKIEFDYAGFDGAAVLGQVLRFNRCGLNTVMHIKFLKVPRKTMNTINLAVFNYYEA